MGRDRTAVFVAMSGVRVVDDELRDLGLTLPGFIERGRVIASLPSLGALTIAAYLPPAWRAEYVEIDAWGEGTPAAVLAMQPDLVLISSLSARIDDAYRLADALRAEGVPVAIGGLHASVMPDEAAAHADWVVVGEGEGAMAELAARCEAGLGKGVIRAPKHRFEHPAPLPRYDLLDVDRYNRLTVQTTRGCPLDCSFCAASRLISAFKRKPIPQVREEIEAVLQHWPGAFLELADDNTFVSKKWAKELVREISRHGVRWFTESDLSVADDPELLDLLADSGCAQILIGLESVSEDSLAGLDSRDWKRRQRESYIEKIARIQERGISVNGCFVLGLDSDGPDAFERTRDFVRASGLTEVQVTVMTPFPGTRLTSELEAAGRLPERRYWDRCTLFDVVYEPALMSAEELRQGFRWLVGELYSVPETNARKAAFRKLRRARKGVAFGSED